VGTNWPFAAGLACAIPRPQPSVMSDVHFAVREVAPTDAPEVARLFAELGYDWPAHTIAARLAAFLATGERALVAARAATGSPLLGVLTLHITPVLHRAGPVGRLTSLVVDEAARGQGVGRALVAAAEKYFTAHGCVLVEVTSNKRRAEAHAFYEHLGYSGTSFRFAKSLSPAD
jgi:ribosomal protein S18 acetylase RimI-like enzyme